MARSLVRVGLAALVGAALGGAFWLQDLLRPEWRRVFESEPLSEVVLGTGLVAAALVSVFDSLGLDLPILPQRRRPTLEEYVAGDRAEPESAPPRPRAAGSPGLLASALAGDATPWVAPERAARMQARIREHALRLHLMLAGQLLLGVGVIARVFLAGTLGFFGEPAAANVLVWLSLVPYAVLLWIGGWPWRVLALGFGALTLWVLAALA